MKINKLLLILVGVISVILGTIGTLVPVLPTTPFIILASVCFAKSSPKFNSWLIQTKVYNKYALDYLEDNSMILSRKIKLLALSSTMLMFPLFLLKNTYLRLLIVLVILFKYYFFIFKIKTKRGDLNEQI